MPAIPPNEYLRKYERIDPTAHLDPNEPWLSKPELPTSSEIMNVSDEMFVDVPSNTIDGPWSSRNDYLGSHYELLREDAVSPLRDAVAYVVDKPRIKDNGDLCVHIIGFTFSHLGPAARVVISLSRAGKRILWQQSKRLVPGTLVALSPADDGFVKHCIVATVAARPLAGVEANPAEVDIFFAHPEDVQINPLREWIMVEARGGYFEAYRHSLVALQRLMTEKFPLSEYLVNLTKESTAPKYLKENPCLDLSNVFCREEARRPLENVDVLKTWPEIKSSTLDESQVSALRNILTRELAIVQGPPGTGKTYVSVLALKAILTNASKEDPPVIITAQTNHALDQLLRHIATFEPNFIRLGGRTTDQGVIKSRTLHEVRKIGPTPRISGGVKGPALRQFKDLVESMITILTPLQQKDPLSPEVLRNLGVINDAQCESFNRDARDWVRIVDGDHPPGVIALWLGDSLLPVDNYHKPDDFGFEVEEVDLEFEQLREMEAETSAHSIDGEEGDSLKGAWFPLQVHYQGDHLPIPQPVIQQALGKTDMWEIPDHLRGAVYNHLWAKAVSILEASFREKAKHYAHAVRQLKLGKWELDSAILQNSKVIGLTTTGLSKYRGLVASLRPRIIVVEEAAETFEGLIASACMESVEHLILVGDHKQLRAHCSVQQLEVAPYNLGISMFERLIINGVNYSQLTRQRRMIPEIRKLLNPIYENLQDHPTVLERPAVPGMGGINSLFFTHRFVETTDRNVSRCNKSECDMIVGFFDYLVLNGVKPADITVLTFYAGQKRMVLKALRNHVNLQGHFFKVSTVDSFQGEENKIILLSLVRSNAYDEIGFLSNANRVCVALSRAQRGLYLFGNDTNLRKDPMWKSILDILCQTPGRLFSEFPLTCAKHTHRIWIKDPIDWSLVNGGCRDKCGDTLLCGHQCGLKCHPFEHDGIPCNQPCNRYLKCGHACTEFCRNVCRCAHNCSGLPRPAVTAYMQPRAGAGPSRPLIAIQEQPQTEVAAWAAFANGGAAVEDAKIYNQRKTQLIEYQKELMEMNRDGLPGLVIRVLESQELSKFDNPAANSTSPGPNMSLGDGMVGGEEVRGVPETSNKISQVVRRAWREVVSTGDHLTPIKSQHAIANTAEVAYRPAWEEPSLLD